MNTLAGTLVGAWAGASVATLAACTPQGASQPPGHSDDSESVAPTDPVERAAQKIAEGKPDQALALLEAELANAPDDHELWFSKGVAQREMGDVDGALESWERTLALEPDFFGALHARGAVYLERERWPEAIDALNQAAVAKPDFADVHYNLALALLGAGAAGAKDRDYVEAAVSALSTAHQLAPDDPDIAMELAGLHVKRGQLERAEPLLVLAVDKAASDPRVHAALGRLRLKQGDGQAALTAFEAALRLQPEDASFELGRSQALLRLNRSEEAEQRLAALSERAPESAVVWLEWGTALAKQGKLKAALEKIETAVGRAPHLVSAQVRRIGLLSDLHRCKDAKAALKTLERTTKSAEAIRVAGTAVAACRR